MPALIEPQTLIKFTSPIDPHIDVAATPLLLVSIALFFICFGLFSQLIRGRYFIPSPVFAVLLGILLGPKGFALLASSTTGSDGWVNGDEDDNSREILSWACRIVLGIQVLSAGLNLPSRYVAVRTNLLTLATLLLPIMASAWMISACFAYWIIPGLTFAGAMIIGSCLGPTDPVLAGSVIKGHFATRHVAPSLRNVILSESGVNDGFGTPFLYMSLSILFAYTGADTHSPRTAAGILGHFVLSVLLYNVLLSLVIGIVVGYGLRKLLVISQNKNWIDKDSMLVFSAAAAVFLVGITTLLDTNQLLCCFVAGCVLNWRDDMGQILHTEFSEGLDNIMDVIIFTIFGAVLPFNTWRGEDSPLAFGRLCAIAALVILFRRLPAVMLFSKGLTSIEKTGEKVFLGWFGPIGVGALYYSLEAAEKIPGTLHLERQIFQVVSFIVFISVFVHGLTIPCFLITTLFQPKIAPYFLGERSHVGEDFGPDGTLPHLVEPATGDGGSDNERQPLLKNRSQPNGEANA